MSFRRTQHVDQVTHQKGSTAMAKLDTNLHIRSSCRKKRNRLKSQYPCVLYAPSIYINMSSQSHCQGFFLLVFTNSPLYRPGDNCLFKSSDGYGHNFSVGSARFRFGCALVFYALRGFRPRISGSMFLHALLAGVGPLIRVCGRTVI
jgi:hypothetical protein